MELIDIRKEHHQVELLRLQSGLDGCGCKDCQVFYAALDLSKYGDRVKRYGGFIQIVAGKTGADLWEEYHRPESWDNTGQVFFTDGRGYALDYRGTTVDVGKEADILKAFDTDEIADELHPGQTEVLQETLDYRKEIKDDGKQPELQRPGSFRSRIARKAKRGVAHFKPAAFRKRVAGNTPKR